jgi:hypothetical protein
MFKILLSLSLLVTISYATSQSKSCTKDLVDMTSFYYLAEKEADFNDMKKAIIDFKKSYNSSYLALDSCEDENNYDFNHIYSYIIATENKIQKIKEDMLEFSLIKN